MLPVFGTTSEKRDLHMFKLTGDMHIIYLYLWITALVELYGLAIKTLLCTLEGFLERAIGALSLYREKLRTTCPLPFSPPGIPFSSRHVRGT